MKLVCYSLWPDAPRIVAARASRRWMDEFPDRHAYRCLPLAIANTHGWEILTPCAFAIHWTGGPAAADLRFESEDGYPWLDHFIASNFTRGIVTFHTGHLFRTEPGWNLMATGPINDPKDGIAPLTGVVETHWLPYPFTMNWQMTRPGSVRFAAGEPFCHVFPVPQDALEGVEPEIRDLDSEPELKQQYDLWRTKREEFMVRFRDRDPETLKQAWQRYYFKGQLPGTDGIVETHKNRIRLAEPVDRREPRR